MNENIEKFPKQNKQSVAIQLQTLAEKMQGIHLNQLFAEQADRFEQFSLSCDDLTFDFSKQRVNHEVVRSLVAWAESKHLNDWIKRLFSEETINYTEQRAAMHWALRLPKNTVQFPMLSKQVHTQLDRMFRLVEKIHAGQ